MQGADFTGLRTDTLDASGAVTAASVTVSGAVTGGTVVATTGLTVGGDEVSTKKIVSVPITVTANAAVATGIVAIPEDKEQESLEVTFIAPPVSTLGTVVIAVENYDADGAADDNMLDAATEDIEAAVANTPLALTLTETAADLLLETGDYLKCTVTSDNADMTGATGGTITAVLQPN